MFQCIMELIFYDFILNILRMYLNDDIIYGPMEKHVEHLEQILDMCWQNNVSFNAENVHFNILMEWFWGI